MPLTCWSNSSNQCRYSHIATK